eukprot:1769419-Pleurochrysis_carterae.AAC.3
MEFMGAKDALTKIAHLNIGLEDTLSYYDEEEFAKGFKKTMAFQPRVIKQNRGSSGEGIWIIKLKNENYCSTFGERSCSDDEVLELMEANDNHAETHTVGEFIEFCVNGARTHAHTQAQGTLFHLATHDSGPLDARTQLASLLQFAAEWTLCSHFQPRRTRCCCDALDCAPCLQPPSQSAARTILHARPTACSSPWPARPPSPPLMQVHATAIPKPMTHTPATIPTYLQKDSPSSRRPHGEERQVDVQGRG